MHEGWGIGDLESVTCNQVSFLVVNNYQGKTDFQPRVNTVSQFLEFLHGSNEYEGSHGTSF